MEKKYEKKAVIITALDVEYRAVQRYLTNIDEVVHKRGNVYGKGLFESEGQRWEVGLVQCGMGNAEAALHTERAISHFNPDVVLFVGIAGGIKDVKLGDVVASEKVYNYESGKDKGGFQPRHEIQRPSFAIGERAKHEVKSDAWTTLISDQIFDQKPIAHFGAIAAGEKVLADNRSTTYWFLKKQYDKALAVEMEGYGFLSAAYANQEVQSLLIRGISDLIENKEDSDKAGWQEKASKHASAFAFYILKKFVPVDTPHNGKPQCFHIPHQRNRFFTGREDILKKLHESLSANHDVALTQAQAISGLGGIGKTQTAVEYAYRHKDNYKAVLWVKADSHSAIESSYVDIAAKLGLPARDPKDQKLVVEDVKNWFTEKTGWLVIFDNVDDREILDKIRPDYIPLEAVGAVLVTTRLRAVGRDIDATALDELTPDDGAKFLLLRAKIGKGDA